MVRNTDIIIENHHPNMVMMLSKDHLRYLRLSILFQEILGEVGARFDHFQV